MSRSGKVLKVVAVLNGLSFGQRVSDPNGTVRPIPIERSPRAFNPKSFKFAVMNVCAGGGHAALPFRSPLAVAPVGLVKSVDPPEISAPAMN
jgi:hypothetical protein